MITQTETKAECIPDRVERGIRPSHRHRPERNEKVAIPRHRVRLVFFCLAAVWGFLCGALGLAAVLSMHGRVIAVEDPLVLLLLIPALAVALLGSTVAASAYREARRRMK